ncbi:MAG: class I SAM-dependent methyltransferase [Chitinophagaceae bacterium]|nr:class I SAM-dependent methyltransferase [Chitinophagaceae bacterium]
MQHKNTRDHWEAIYKEKDAENLSWYEVFPYISLYIITQLKLSRDAAIIDVGGGDSHLVDFLLREGYRNITILDISQTAINKAKARLGKQSEDKVNWIVSDILDFKPSGTYDFWHDRATFHFLTDENSIGKYVSIAHNAVKEQGHISLGTFSTKGPEVCSGLYIRQYSEDVLSRTFHPFFQKIRCLNHMHFTPADAEQNFIFCLFNHQFNHSKHEEYK